MLSGLFSKFFQHKNEVKECYGLDNLDNLDDDVIGHLPSPKGIPIVQPNVLIQRLQQEIKPIRTELGMSYEDFDRYIRPVMYLFIQYVDLLPASEVKHHKSGGGLVSHSFDVAKRAMRRAQHTQYPIGIGTIADTQQSKIQWKVGTVLAALFHDAGKVLTDVVVTNGADDAEQVIEWDPHSEDTIYQWASKHQLERYFVRWRKHRHKKHENASLMVMQRLIPQETWSWLGNCFDGHDIHSAMLSAVAKAGLDHPMSKIVAESDSDSAIKDLFKRRSHITKELKQIPISEVLCDLMKHNLLTNKWLVNARSAQVWYVDKKLYLVWSAVVPLLVEEVLATGYTIPSSPELLAKLMIEEGMAFKNGDELLFDVYPEILGDGKKAVKLSCLKIRNVDDLILDPSKLYSIKEHPKKPKSIEPSEGMFVVEDEPEEIEQEAAPQQKMYESSLETVNRVLSMMKCQVVQNEQSEAESTREESPDSLVEPADSYCEASHDDTQETNPTNQVQPLNCHLAEFVHQEFKFAIENGCVVVPRERLFDVEEALTGSGIEGITPFNAHAELVASKEVRIHE